MRNDVSQRLSPDGTGFGGSGISAANNVFRPGVGMTNSGAPSPASGSTPAPAAGGAPAPEAKPKITAFKTGLGSGHHEENWIRSTNKTGTGATHVRSFHCKLVEDSLGNLDKQINEWLDTHPDYEVKFVTTAVGEWTGKLKEPHMIVNVWV